MLREKGKPKYLLAVSASTPTMLFKFKWVLPKALKKELNDGLFLWLEVIFIYSG